MERAGNVSNAGDGTLGALQRIYGRPSAKFVETGLDSRIIMNGGQAITNRLEYPNLDTILQELNEQIRGRGRIDITV